MSYERRGAGWLAALAGLAFVSLGAGITLAVTDAEPTVNPITGTTTVMVQPPAPVVAECGPDLATAAQTGINQIAPPPFSGSTWVTDLAVGGTTNYDPCADLSTVLVFTSNGTGSSPMQALMFHRGVFLGTGTLKPYGFTTLDSAASTGDTVVLQYRSGQSCDACGGGVLNTVRYHWDGTKVDMLDPAPPE